MLASAPTLFFARRANFTAAGSTNVSANQTSLARSLARRVHATVDAVRASTFAPVIAGQKSVAGSFAEHGKVERVQFQGLVGEDVARDVDQMPATVDSN